MFPSDLELLYHILDEIDFILENYAAKHYTEIENDPLLSRAVIRSLEIIGEASKKISPELKNTYPTIEWRKIAGTRDRLIHNYFGIDYDIVIDIIQSKLPDLKFFIKEIIVRYQSKDSARES
ncbi:DUF86 domain-containing protein [Rubrolithibacter danxiaensis]|uniref:HepT-like ribonuclease domain-containing protein n=1 Tax=Rubrolithibacter danxiaensis TaxID=3390805 RepID=UPI003BF7C3C7